MLFYVRRHTGADGSFEWYVLTGHTRRRASKFFPTRAATAAEREKLQVKLDLAKEQVLRRTPKGSAVKPNKDRAIKRRPVKRTRSDARALASAKRAPARKPGGAGGHQRSR